MNHYKKPTKYSQIKKLLLVIISASLTAFVISGILLYNYSPTNTTILSNALINPEVAQKLHYEENLGSKNYFTFQSIELDLLNDQTLDLQKKELSLKQYKKIYSLLSKDKSIKETKQLEDRFKLEPLTKLNILVKSDKNSNARPLQQMEILPNSNYYRIKIPQQNQWIYFEHYQLNDRINTIVENEI